MKQREWSAVHYAKSRRALERDIYPALGNLPIARITPAIVAKAIEDIQKRDVLETTAQQVIENLTVQPTCTADGCPCLVDSDCTKYGGGLHCAGHPDFQSDPVTTMPLDGRPVTLPTRVAVPSPAILNS